MTEAETVLEITDEQLEELMGENPCEYPGCSSELKASFFATHEDAKPGCTIMICEKCAKILQDWIANLVVRNGTRNNFSCRRCGKDCMNYKQLVVRSMG